MSISKEKRTKEQVMRLLDRAIEQEEILLESVKVLEAELADCRKKAENPRHELEEKALPDSKVSFRLDYYRTEKKGPLKCIIEHLPTRECRSFDGSQFREIDDFVTHYIGPIDKLQARAERPKTNPVFPPELIENTSKPEKEAHSTLLQKLLPDIFGSPAAVAQKPTLAEPTPVVAQSDAEPFWVLTAGAEKHQRALRRGQPFQIQIPQQTLNALQGKACNVHFLAKSLEKKPAPLIEAVERCTPDQDRLQIPAQALPFELGVYRLVVSMAFLDDPKTNFYKADRVLIVQEDIP